MSGIVLLLRARRKRRNAAADRRTSYHEIPSVWMPSPVAEEGMPDFEPWS